LNLVIPATQADVTTGTWILDAAQNVPNDTTLYGVDIEPRLFPFLGRKNVHFSVASVTALPSYWTNTFQLVNQRLLVAALTGEQWKLAVQELKRVLAPGGALQLGEVGVWRAGPKTQRHLELMRALFTSRTLVLNCASQIPAMLDAAGFASISTQKRSLPLGGSAGADGRRNFIDVFR
jgi:ubiquinone/menaquinone biosynthesis C-methylase UbiE